MAKDQTEIGITGKLVPKPSTAKKQYELEKKRRMQKHLGKNVGGAQYSSDVNPYYNPRQRTFEEFMSLVEEKKNKNEPPNAVPGTYKVNLETGSRSYTLKPADPNEQGPFTKKEIFKSLANQGGIGGKAVRKGVEQREKELKKLRKKNKVAEGFSYGSKSFQQTLEKKRKQEAQEKETERQQNADAARRAFRTKGVPFSDAKGKGHIVNGVKHYDT